MENLTKKPFDFGVGNQLIAKYLESDAEGHYFQTADQRIHIVPLHVHTDDGVKQIKAGDVVKIVKTPQGFDVYSLDANDDGYFVLPENV